MASSRVGTTINALTLPSLGVSMMRSIVGSKKAAVFPVPVWAIPKMSVPFKA